LAFGQFSHAFKLRLDFTGSPFGCALPLAVAGASGWGNNELISYHDGRGPGGDGEEKGEDEE
jgi:hypothetical protein